MAPQLVDAFLAERSPGDTIVGRVHSTVAFGAFVELAPGAHGLLHEFEYRELPEPGYQLDVRIADVDRERRRISLTPLYSSAW